VFSIVVYVFVALFTTGWKSLLNNNFVGRKKGAINKNDDGGGEGNGH